MMLKKPWSRIHLENATNFMRSNCLVLIAAYSKYFFILSKTSIFAKSTVIIFKKNFAHFGIPYTIGTDNATSFTSELN